MKEGKIKILDLFCGIGGVAKGFQRYLLEQGMSFEYYAVDVDPKVLRAHKKFNPLSNTILRDAYSFTDDELLEFDFIWASPPCETHSRLNFYNWGNPKKYKEPDMRFYELIEMLYRLNIPFVVENVEPYYKPPIKPSVKVYRHVLWTNLSIRPFRVDLPNFSDVKDDVKSLTKYHGVPRDVVNTLGTARKARSALRDMVNPIVSYNIAKQIFPQVLEGKKFVQVRLGVFARSCRRVI